MKSAIRLQRGFSMISAVFLLVVLAAIGAGLASLSATQHGSLALDVQGARAYQAARAGIEWGLYQSMVQFPAPGACPATTSFVPAALTLKSFTVTVQCNDSSTTPVMRQLVAVACNEPDSSGDCPGATPTGEYVERRLQATVQR
jgi:MSHA biogenesis protein MshP